MHEQNSLPSLGSFEELILLAVASLPADAYGVTVLDEIRDRAGKTVTLGAVHATLYRLEEKGFLSSQMGRPTAERGGRRKRLFAVTGSGLAVLRAVREIRESMWQRIPGPEALT